MPSGNVIRLAFNVATTFSSAVITPQMVREEAVTFWVWISGTSGAICEIRGSPDLQAENLTSPVGGVLHKIITSGTATPGQTKVDANGHAVVVVQAHPRMYLRWIGGLGSDRLYAYAIE